MRIALFANLARSQALPLAIGIREYLESKKVEVYAEKEVAKAIHALELKETTKINFRITLGGDGTIIRMLHRHPQIDAPVLGINHGGLGFMADTPVKDIYTSLDALLAGSYILQDRLMIEGAMYGENKGFALNEIVIHRGENLSLIEMLINVDGVYLNTFSADGIIISTPNGSTAYSLASGGPILTPNLDAIVITPICPHTISNRPIVLLPKKEIQVQYISEYKPAQVIYDGFSHHAISTGDMLTIKRSKRTFQLVLLKDHDYFSILRTKLGWSGKLKA